MDKNDIIERLAGRLVVASVSGGKDSAAMSLYLMELGIEHRRVFMDTGWESPKTYDYLRGPLTQALGPIEEIQSEVGGMQAWTSKKGMFPSRRRRWCTEELKVKPMIRYMDQFASDEVVNTVGIRNGESLARSKLTEWEWSDGFDCEVWRPIITWSEQDVIDIHTRHGLRPNPLYLEGFSRVGCFPCIFARKSEIRLIAERYPERIDLLRMLEEKTTADATKRYEQRGDERSPARSFFQSPMGDKGEASIWQIDSIVSWSKTEHGGRQMMLLDAAMESQEDAGCMRWGLCETHPEPPLVDSAKKDPAT